MRRPDKTLATADHNVPTDGTPAARLIADELSRVQVEALERNCEEFGIPIYSLGSERQGIVHVIGPELGATQPGMTIVCGDSHTSTHGAFGALAFGIGTSEVEHVLATQCLVQRRPKTMRISYSGELGCGVTAKDLILATIGRLGVGGMQGHAVEYAGQPIEALTMEHRMTICNMTIEGGGRAGMIAPDETTFEYVQRPPGRPRGLRGGGGATGASCRPRRGPASTREVEVDAGAISPMVTWGTTPGDGGRGDRPGPRPGRRWTRPADREAAERALAYMDLQAGTPMTDIPLERVFIGSCTNSRISDLREAASIVEGRKVHSSLRGDGRARLRSRSRRRPRRRAWTRSSSPPGFEWREAGCSMCLGMNPDILSRGRALRLDLQPQLRGPPGRRRAHPPGQPEDGRRRRDRGPLRRHQGVELRWSRSRSSRASVAVLDRSDVDTDQIIPKQFLKRIERTGFGEFLFYDWFRSGEIELEPHPILVTGRNFGSGSSREHAVWALKDYGFEAVIAPVVLRHLLFQLHQERAAAGRARRGALPRGRRRRARRGSTSTTRPSTARTASSSSRSTRRSSTGCSTASTTSAMTLERAEAIDAFEAAGRADAAR